MTNRVRVAGKALNQGFSRRELFQAVNTRTRAEDMAFKEAWLELIRRGELVKLDSDKYRYDPDKAARAHVKIRVFRAMHVKGAFCASDIAKLSEADISYVQTLIRKMVWDEWLEFTGTKERVKFFRVRNSEKFYLKYVK
jgi:hypothetical protein